jgi:hypothetical protein
MNLILGQSRLGKAVFVNKNFKKEEEIIELKDNLYPIYVQNHQNLYIYKLVDNCL